jgi:predicted nucleotidyltransferase
LADGQALPLSDVDLALVLRPDPSFSAYDRIRMEFEIAAEVESQCAISPVDVRSMNDAPLPVRGMVVTEGILLFSRDEEFRIDFEVYTRKLYFDFLPTQEMMRQAFFESLKKEGLLGDKTR